jgi:hypothetical protein
MTKTEVGQIKWESFEWINMFQGMNQRWTVVGTPLKFCILEIGVISSEESGGLSSESVLYGVSYFHFLINRTE